MTEKRSGPGQPGPQGDRSKMGKRGPRPRPPDPAKPLEKVVRSMGAKVARGLALGKPRTGITPRAFLEAVINCDMKTMVAMGFTDLPTMKMRLAASIELMKYDEQRMPLRVVTERADAQWAQSIQTAQDRANNLRRERRDDGPATEPVIIDVEAEE